MKKKLTIDLDDYSEKGSTFSESLRLDEVFMMKKITFDLLSKREREIVQDMLNKFGHGLNGELNVAKKEKEDLIWKPKEAQPYWHVDIHGTSRVERFHRAQGSFDEVQYVRGNVFKTEEAAQRMAERRKRIGIFENKMMEFAEGYKFKLPYKEDKYVNFFIEWQHDTKRWESDNDCEWEKPLAIYMSEENAEKAVEWANKHYPEGL